MEDFFYPNPSKQAIFSVVLRFVTIFSKHLEAKGSLPMRQVSADICVAASSNLGRQRARATTSTMSPIQYNIYFYIQSVLLSVVVSTWIAKGLPFNSNIKGFSA